MKIVLIAGLDRSLLIFRTELIQAMQQLGHEVVCAAPAEHDDVPPALARIGARFVPIALSRTTTNPFADWRSYRAMIAVLRRERPELVLSYTIKPVIFGTLAAARVGVVHRHALITGLGSAFFMQGWKGRGVRFVVEHLYRRALRKCSCVFVQNAEIKQIFEEKRIVKANQVQVVRGSGIALENFPRTAFPPGDARFLFLGRLLRDKGIMEFCEAAKILKREIPSARFIIAGAVDSNPTGIALGEIQRWHREGVIELLPFQSDVRPLLQQCTTYVLPSYHEGLPRSVLEAMATGRPVITTDTIGCRETVINAGAPDSEGIRTGDNGLLVPVRSVEPLAAAMLRLATDAGLRERMGSRGREIAEQQFDVRLINDVMLRAMDLLPASASNPRIQLSP